MKKYFDPNIEIMNFAEENVVTGSDASIVDEWNQTNGYNAQTIDWENLKDTKITVTF